MHVTLLTLGSRAGVPSVAVPVFADQFFWGERIAALGAGLCLPRRRLTSESLARVIVAASEPAMQSKAAELGSRLRVEKGVERAVDELRSLLGG